MKVFLILSASVLMSINAYAADFTLQLIPADASVSDVKVSDVTIGKVTGLQPALDACAKSTDLAPLSPVGTIAMFGGSTAPSGWLITDGSPLSTTTYAKLFAVIGYTYGGSGSTFNLPNTQGVFVRSAGSQTIGGIGYSGNLSSRVGDQVQGHTHQLGYSTGAPGPGNFAMPSAYTTAVASYQSSGVGGMISDGHGNPRVGTETMPANISLNYMIKY